MPKKVMIGANKPTRYTGGGPFIRSNRDNLAPMYSKEVQREIYLAAKRVQARPMRALHEPKPKMVPMLEPLTGPGATGDDPIPPMGIKYTLVPKPISRQQLWMERQEKAGNCRRCGAKRTLYAQFCDSCMGKVRERRAKVGNEKRPGRPLKK